MSTGDTIKEKSMISDCLDVILDFVSWDEKINQYIGCIDNKIIRMSKERYEYIKDVECRLRNEVIQEIEDLQVEIQADRDKRGVDNEEV